MSRPREFHIAWIHRYVAGQFVETKTVITENPTSDDLENNGVHVIEKSAYDELKAKLEIAEKALAKLDSAQSPLEASTTISEEEIQKSAHEYACNMQAYHDSDGVDVTQVFFDGADWYKEKLAQTKALSHTTQSTLSDFDEDGWLILGKQRAETSVDSGMAAKSAYTYGFLHGAREHCDYIEANRESPLVTSLDEAELDKATKLHVKALHAKRQWHFQNPEKRGPLPSPLDQEGYMFKAGARWASQRNYTLQTESDSAKCPICKDKDPDCPYEPESESDNFWKRQTNDYETLTVEMNRCIAELEAMCSDTEERFVQVNKALIIAQDKIAELEDDRIKTRAGLHLSSQRVAELEKELELQDDANEILIGRIAEVKKERDELKAEVERFRAALKYIDDVTFDTLLSPLGTVVNMVSEKARKALKGEGDE